MNITIIHLPITCLLLLIPAATVLGEDPPAGTPATTDTAVTGSAATPATADGNTPTDSTPTDSAPTDSTQTDNKPADSAPPPPRVTPVPSARRQQAVRDYLQNSPIRGERVDLTTAETGFMGLFVQETRGKPQGAALILHDDTQHLLWPEMIAPLQQQLPGFGWATLTIEIDDAPGARVAAASQYEVSAPDNTTNSDNTTSSASPAATDTTATATTAPNEATATSTSETPPPTPPETTSNSADNEPPLPTPAAAPETAVNPGATDGTAATATSPATAEPAAPTLAERQARWLADTEARIQAAMAWLESRGQLNRVIIASGHNSSWAIQYIRANSELNEKGEAKPGLALVLMQANNHPLAPMPLTSSLPELAVPVLDVVSGQYPHDLPQAEIDARAGAMRHQQRRRYRQYELGIVAGRIDNDDLVRSVRGWLKTNAAGTELGRR